jgi:hypothetical protein
VGTERRTFDQSGLAGAMQVAYRYVVAKAGEREIFVMRFAVTGRLFYRNVTL